MIDIVTVSGEADDVAPCDSVRSSGFFSIPGFFHDTRVMPG